MHKQHGVDPFTNVSGVPMLLTMKMFHACILILTYIYRPHGATCIIFLYIVLFFVVVDIILLLTFLYR